MSWFFETPGFVDKDLHKHVHVAGDEWHAYEARSNLDAMLEEQAG